MTPRELSIDVQQSLVKTLKNYFPETFPEEKKIGPMPTPDVNWENAAPLLAQITTDRTLAKTLKNEFNLLKDSRYIIQNLNEICFVFRNFFFILPSYSSYLFFFFSLSVLFFLSFFLALLFFAMLCCLL